jgi:hypothetical protein
LEPVKLLATAPDFARPVCWLQLVATSRRTGDSTNAVSFQVAASAPTVAFSMPWNQWRWSFVGYGACILAGFVCWSHLPVVVVPATAPVPVHFGGGTSLNNGILNAFGPVEFCWLRRLYLAGFVCWSHLVVVPATAPAPVHFRWRRQPQQWHSRCLGTSGVLLAMLPVFWPDMFAGCIHSL